MLMCYSYVKYIQMGLKAWKHAESLIPYIPYFL